MVGITVTLYERQRATAGTPPAPAFDVFGDAVYAYGTAQSVANVLVGQPTAEEIQDSINLCGKAAEFMLGIPKGDAHAWEDSKIEFFGQTWRAIGPVIQGIEANVPTPWHKKIRVVRYE